MVRTYRANSNKQEESASSKLSIDLQKASMDEKLDYLCMQMTNLTADVEHLKKESIEKDKKIKTLETKISDLEQYTRKDDLVITGIETPKSSYSDMATSSSEQQNENASDSVTETLEGKVISVLNKYGIAIKSSDISVCHTIGKKDPTRNQPIVVRLISRKTKSDILRNANKLKASIRKDPKTGAVVKGSGIFINEHLTQQNAAIARMARIMKKEGKLVSTWTKNCKIYVKVKEHGDQFQVKIIRSIEELEQLN